MRSTRSQHQSLILTLTLLTLTALGALTLPRLHSAPAARPPQTVGPRAPFDREIRHHAQRLLEQTGPEPYLHQWGVKPTRSLTI
jgi:hypothetical protein